MLQEKKVIKKGSIFKNISFTVCNCETDIDREGR